MKIYAACIASHHAGLTHGQWIDVTDADDVHDSIATMLKRSPVPGAEEYAIRDHDFPVYVDEHHDVDELCEMASFIEEHDEAGIAAIQLGESLSEAKRLMDGYQGEYGSFADFACTFASENMELPDHWLIRRDVALRYFDFELYAQTELRHDFITHRVTEYGYTHVFLNV